MKTRGKQKTWSAPLADFVGQAIDPVLAKQGFGQSDVILHWDEIAGPRLASQSEPLRILWPHRAPKRDPQAPTEPATLVVQVEGAFALDLQHLAPVILERVNAHLGWRCVGRMQIKQGPLRRRAVSRAPKRVIDPAALAVAEMSSADIVDPPLRAALTRLGAMVLSRRKIPGDGG